MREGQRPEHGGGEVLARTRAAQRALDELADTAREVAAPAGESLHRRVLGDAECCGDVANRSVLAVVQDERLAIALGDPRQRFAHHPIDLRSCGGVEWIAV